VLFADWHKLRSISFNLRLLEVKRRPGHSNAASLLFCLRGKVCGSCLLCVHCPLSYHANCTLLYWILLKHDLSFLQLPMERGVESSSKGFPTFLWPSTLSAFRQVSMYPFRISKDKHVSLQNFDRWTCTPKISYDKILYHD